jgi:hypothetical protein
MAKKSPQNKLENLRATLMREVCVSSKNKEMPIGHASDGIGFIYGGRWLVVLVKSC